jgi:hypothetical protein
MSRQTNIELDQSRSIRELIVASAALYLRFPILFLVLAGVAVVPYEVIVLLVTGGGPLALGRTGFVTSNLFTVFDSFLVTPLISALHVRAVREVGDGSRPRLVPTFRQSLSTLPVVAIAAGISSVAILIGSFALLVPGLLLMARWAVVAQTAALDGGSWKDPLRRSADLTDGYRWHSFGLVITAGLVAFVPSLALGAVFGHKSTTAASFIAGTGLQVLLRSFEALITALLYFDLKARPRGGEHQIGVQEWDPNVPVSAAPAGTGDPLTPDGYTDADRPRGWYIDPDKPSRMRYWAASSKPVWSQRTAKTPGQTLVEWEKLRESRGGEDIDD